MDAENALRSAALEFMDTVRGAEQAIAAGRRGEDVPEELDVATLGVVTEEEWRAHWPSRADADHPEPTPESEPADEAEPRRRSPSRRLERRRDEDVADGRRRRAARSQRGHASHSRVAAIPRRNVATARKSADAAIGRQPNSVEPQ